MKYYGIQHFTVAPWDDGSPWVTGVYLWVRRFWTNLSIQVNELIFQRLAQMGERKHFTPHFCGVRFIIEFYVVLRKTYSSGFKPIAYKGISFSRDCEKSMSPLFPRKWRKISVSKFGNVIITITQKCEIATYL